MNESKYQIDMRQGPLLRQILLFAIPLMLTGFLQLLYNAVDIIVIGQFDGTIAQGAISSTSQLIALFVGAFFGISAGSSVICSRFTGARDFKAVEKIVHTSIALSIVVGIFLAILGVFFSDDVLKLMRAPDETFDLSVRYLSIYFLGMPATMIYNFGASILRSIGDTRRPLYFLATAGVVNLFFNIFFVAILDMGVTGVAIATVIAQVLSMILVLRTLHNVKYPHKLVFSKISIDKTQLRFILKVGLPLGLQSSLFSLSNVFVQSSFNSFNSATILAGIGTSNVLTNSVAVLLNSFQHTCLNFSSQNLGACQYMRMRQVYYYSVGLVFVVGIIIGSFFTFASPILLRIFTSDPAVIEIASNRLYYLVLPIFICGVNDVTSGQLRGIGNFIAPTVISLACICGIRILWIYTVFSYFGTLESLYISHPVSWGVSLIIQFTFYTIVIKKFPKKNSTISPN